MRELRFVGPGDDRTVILESDNGKQYRLRVDDRLISAVQPTTEKPEHVPAAREDTMTELRPREIQMRVRAGEEPQALAEEAGQPLEKIMRFAFPVLQERVRIVEEARRGRARHGSEAGPATFGELVDTRIAALGTEPGTVAWDSFRRPDGGWTISSRFTATGHQQQEIELRARFSFALTNRTVSALNDVAADLLTGNPITALLPPAPVPAEPAPLSEAEQQSWGAQPGWAGQGGGSEQPGASGPRLAAVPDQPPAAGERRSHLRLPSRRQKAHTHPVPVSADEELFEELFDQEAPDPHAAGWHEPPLPLEFPAGPPDSSPQYSIPGATDQPYGQLAYPADAPAGLSAAPRPSSDEPELTATATEGRGAVPPSQPEAPAQPEAEPAEPHRRARSSDKPKMPSWDDILLGVRRKND